MRATQRYVPETMGAWSQEGGRHGGRIPLLIQTVGIEYAISAYIFLFRFRNILVSHQVAPPLYNKIAPMPDTYYSMTDITENAKGYSRYTTLKTLQVGKTKLATQKNVKR